MSSINWQDLMTKASKAGEIPPPGTYHARVEHVDVTTTSAATGEKPMLKVRYRIVSGPEADKALFDNMVVSEESPTALSIFFGKLQALGVDAAAFIGQPDDVITAQLAGREAMLTVSHRDWNGAKKTNVDSVSPVQGGSPPPQPQQPAAATPPPPAPTAPVEPQVEQTPPQPPAAPF